MESRIELAKARQTIILQKFMQDEFRRWRRKLSMILGAGMVVAVGMVLAIAKLV
jgi:hypothetical protein